MLYQISHREVWGHRWGSLSHTACSLVHTLAGKHPSAQLLGSISQHTTRPRAGQAWPA